MISNNSMRKDESQKQLQSQIALLKNRLQQQEDLLQGKMKWEGDEIYAELHDLQHLRIEKQAQYKSLMRDHFKFAKGSKLQKQGDEYLQQKLKKMVNNVSHDIDNILYSRVSKSNLSSSSSHSNVQCSDWLQQDKEEENRKKQALIYQEIKELQKILQNLI